MKNIINEKPTDELYGRTLFSTKFVENEDIKNKKILDIGCGFGWFELNVIKKNCNKIIGIELEDKNLTTARKYIKNKRVDFRIGSAINLPFEDSSFDTIVCWEVIEHIPKNTESILFKEVYRVLKPNGSFYLSTPNNSFFSKIFDPAWWLIGHRHYSKKNLINFAEKAEFKVNKSEICGGFWELIGINNLYIAKWIFRRKPFFEGIIKKYQNLEYKKGGGFSTLFLNFNK